MLAIPIKSGKNILAEDFGYEVFLLSTFSTLLVIPHLPTQNSHFPPLLFVQLLSFYCVLYLLFEASDDVIYSSQQYFPPTQFFWYNNSVSWIEDVWEFKLGRSLRMSRLSWIKRSVLLLVLLMISKVSEDIG